MKFGLGPYWLDDDDPYQRFREMAQQAWLAQECAFDSIWMGEAHFTGHCPHPFVPAAALAVKVDSLRMGVLCQLGLVHPAYVAEDAVTLDNISNGRTILAVAPPWRPEETSGYGLSSQDDASRFAEAVQVLKLSWAPQPFSFTGRHYCIPAHLKANVAALGQELVSLTPKPAQPSIPLWAAALPHTLPVAIQQRLPLVGLPWQEMEELAHLFNEYRAGAGSLPADHIWALARVTWVAKSSQEAKEAVESSLPLLARAWAKMLGPHAVSEAQLMGAAIFGDVDDCIGQIRRYQQVLGINYLICFMALPGIPHSHALRAIELWGKAVISEFRMAAFPRQIRERFLADVYGWGRELAPQLQEV